MGRNRAENVAVLEKLESRTLMSAAVAPAHRPPAFVEPAVDGNVKSWLNVSHNPLFAPGGPSMNDIEQGQAGDCWFVATLAEVALRDPSLIRQDIVQRRDGTYDVCFHTSATQTVDEHVDGKLPLNGWNQLEYAQLGRDGCTWVPIMEKALTYFINQSVAPSYQNICGGWGDEALSDLGAAPQEAMPTISNASQLFSQVATSIGQHDDVLIGTSDANGPLVNDHEYSVVATKVTKAGVELIEVRNPWGSNPNFKPGIGGFAATNNGYLWIRAKDVMPEVNEFVTAPA